MYRGTTSGTYPVKTDIQKDLTTHTVSSLENGKTYYFVMTSYDLAGNESGYSNEAVAVIPAVDSVSPGVPTITIKIFLDGVEVTAP